MNTNRSSPAPTVKPASNTTAEPSGKKWVNRFQGSSSTRDLTMPFRSGVEDFVAALRAAGATVTIAATLRDPERAYLMHWSWRVIKKSADPLTIPPMKGVDVCWAHDGADGKYSRERSIEAAREMVRGFNIENLGAEPALHSRHTLGRAIDMAIRWDRKLSITDAGGAIVAIASSPRTGLNNQLRRVGASYGVIKNNRSGRDDPHWSDDGA